MKWNYKGLGQLWRFTGEAGFGVHVIGYTESGSMQKNREGLLSKIIKEYTLGGFLGYINMGLVTERFKC